jgi:hypothetical protein
MRLISRLTHIDGKLANLALMKLAHFHRARGDEVVFTTHIERERGIFSPNINYGQKPHDH